MANTWFQFKQFIIHQDRCAMKVTTDACLFGAWVAKQVTEEGSRAGKILDIGAGSGLLPLMLAQQTEALIDALEIDPEAAAQARENIGASSWPEKISLLQGDARTFTYSHSYDVIVSNPPFYEREWRSGDSKKNIAHHSDALSLEELLGIIRKQLAPGGIFYLLLPYKRNAEARKLLFDHAFRARQILLVRQSVQHDYFRILLSGSFGSGDTETIIDEMAITDDRQQYTTRFRELLKDYYLNL